MCIGVIPQISLVFVSSFVLDSRQTWGSDLSSQETDFNQKAEWGFGRDNQLMCRRPEWPRSLLPPEHSPTDRHAAGLGETEGAGKVVAGAGCGSSSPIANGLATRNGVAEWA